MGNLILISFCANFLTNFILNLMTKLTAFIMQEYREISRTYDACHINLTFLQWSSDDTISLFM
jgi:hypothetical protein